MEKEEETIGQEQVEVETPRGIKVRLGSFKKDIDELCVRATELISFASETNGNTKKGSYLG